MTIVIPNWNGEEVLPHCLASLNRQTYRDFHIILVDNGSRDHSVSMARKTGLPLSVIRFDENRGFAPAVNAGIDQSDTPYVLLLNNDVFLDPECLEQLVQFLDHNSHAAVAACRIMQWNNPQKLDSLGNGMSREGKGFQIGWEKTWNGYSGTAPLRVFGTCAACALYRRKAFNEVGGMDADFFAYLEDVDWAFRSNWKGLKTYVIPSAVAYHKGSHTTGGHYNPFVLYFIVRNQLAVLVKNLSLSLMILYMPFILRGQIKTFARAVFLEKHPLIYLRAIAGFLDNLPRFRHKRKEVLSSRTISCREMDRFLRLSEKQRNLTF